LNRLILIPLWIIILGFQLPKATSKQFDSVEDLATTNGDLELTLLNSEGTYNLSIVNSLGQVVKETEINVNNSNQTEKLNINNLSKGLYYVNLFNANNNYISKIVK